jgi:hypothetical protein
MLALSNRWNLQYICIKKFTVLHIFAMTIWKPIRIENELRIRDINTNLVKKHTCMITSKTYKNINTNGKY